ncbi:hypothetical protein AVEN_63714-1 [Araneus ventricosus]|uniref:EF-hand domain-containing protein n=1 Tax=Araneus ventricosus TaxID=182803 RepID=A0A4Y2L8T2_ARAVE|nr:hypothetical protein AVEN_63714-1 [Araneus ventricosus]
MTSSDKGLWAKFELLCKSATETDDKLPLEDIVKWFKHKEVISKDTGITEADVEAAFSKLAKDKNGMEYSEFTEMLTEFAREKSIDIAELKEKLASGAAGRTSGKTADPCKSPRGTIS